MKRLALPLILLLVLSVLAYGTQIEVWLVGLTGEMAGILSDLAYETFTSQTGIEVNIYILTWADYYNRSLLALASRDTPDIFAVGSEVMDFGVRGGLVDLAKFKPDELKEVEAQLFGALMGPVSFHGTRFGVPYDSGGMVTAYRTDILADMGMAVPVTWDDIYNWQPKANAQGRTFGLYYGSVDYASEWGAYTLVTQAGGQFFSEDGFSSALDRPESVVGFKNYVELFTKYNLPRAGVGLEPFINGEWLMLTDGAWLHSNLIKGAPQLSGKWAIDLIPGTKRPNGEINHGSFVGGTYLAISSLSKNKEEAWEFIKWMTSAEVQRRYANTVLERITGSIWLPANRQALREIAVDDSFRETFVKQAEQSAPVPPAINVAVLYRYVKFAVDKSVLNGVDPEVAILDAAKEMNEDMGKRRKEYTRYLQELGVF